MEERGDGVELIGRAVVECSGRPSPWPRAEGPWVPVRPRSVSGAAFHAED